MTDVPGPEGQTPQTPQTPTTPATPTTPTTPVPPPPGMEDYYGGGGTPPPTPSSFGLPESGEPAPAKPSRGMSMALRIVFLIIGATVGYFAVQYFSNGEDPPTEEEVAAAFTPVEGYTYVDVPDAQLQPMEDAIASDPELSNGIAVFDAKTISLGTQPVGAMIIIGIDPDEFGDDYRQEFLDGFKAGSGGAEATSTQINGQEAFEGDALGSHFVAFFDEADGMIFMVIGPNAGSIQQIAESVHAANIT